MPVRNTIVLVTYADSMGRNLGELTTLLRRHFCDCIGMVHLLPFFPSSADRGFAPTRYDIVDPRFGTWEDIEALTGRFDLMVDFMINHISRSSAYFQDFVARKEDSPYAGMFIRYKNFWPAGEPTAEELERIYKRKTRAPCVEVTFADGTAEKIWCTFDDAQIDLDLTQDVTRSFVRDTLLALASRGAAVIRLDAFAYATKRAGTDCFFVEPEVWELLDWTRKILAPSGVEILPEVHERSSIQFKLAEHGYWVYDFALPMILLHTLYVGSNARLLAWLAMCPRKQFTTLDTHDGIGVVDVRGLLSEAEIDNVRETLFSRKANIKRVYNTAAYNNLDVYQINCTYYSALGCNDDAYLLARAIQFFAPGIPQVYYVGLLAGENDLELLERTRIGRNINRHYFSTEEVEESLTRPAVRRLANLMRFRNSYGAFLGNFHIVDTRSAHTLSLRWERGQESAVLEADLRSFRFTITYFDRESSSFAALQGV